MQEFYKILKKIFYLNKETILNKLLTTINVQMRKLFNKIEYNKIFTMEMIKTTRRNVFEFRCTIYRVFPFRPFVICLVSSIKPYIRNDAK